MRTSSQPINTILKDQIIKTLAQTLADTKDPGEALTFLKDFFTNSELQTYAKRLAAVYWLRKHRSYQNIKNNLKLSSATIAQATIIAKKEGLKLAIKKMEAEEWANIWAEKIKKLIRK